MRFLADESLETPVVEALRIAGHDVLAVSELSPGVDDPTVLARAETGPAHSDHERQGLRLARIPAGQASAGIVLVRLASLRSAAKAARLVEVARDIGTALENVMTVVEADSVRRRSFPPSG